MNILIRANSSSFIGTGHIMRDLVLAKKYKDSNIVFACEDLEGNINQKIKDENFTLEIVKTNDYIEVLQLIKKYKIDLLVIDSYQIDFKYEQNIKKNSKVQLLCIDDTYEKHFCDILLNHNIGANRIKYEKLVPSTCIIKCGSRYTLLRDEFYKEKKKKRKINKSKVVFVAMGGADHSNINIEILKVIKKFKNLKVNIITTNANKNIDKLKKYCLNKSWINLYINSNKVAKLMRQSDFSIITPSVTVNEVYFMRLPFIAIKTIINQEEIYNFLKKKGYPTINEFNKYVLQKEISKLIN